MRSERYHVSLWPKALVLVIHLNDSNVPEAEVNLGIMYVSYRESRPSGLAWLSQLRAQSKSSKLLELGL